MQSPPSSDLPPLSPVLAPLSTEEKPARQRLHVKRTYYRKLNLLQTLRDQVHELETVYDQLRAQQHLHEALADAPAFYSALEEDAQNRYSQLSKLKARAIILRSIDPDLLVLQENPPGVREQWLDCYIWVTFERVGEHGHHCLFDFGGEVRCTPVINSDAWMLELLFIVLRWEHHVVGPVFSLGSGRQRARQHGSEMMSPLEEQLPALAPVVTPLTVEEKKARQRLHVKRTYYRKLNLLQTLRHQVHDLEARYERLLQKQHDPVAHDAPDIGNKQDINAGEPVEAELAELRAKLKEENQAMEQLLAQYQQFEDKMSLWARHNVSVDDEGEEEDMVTQGLAPVSLGFIIPSLRAPISSELCQDIVQRTFQDMNRFRHSPIFLTTGMSVFGWRDKRLRDGDRVKFSLKKLFRGISPLALSLRTWAAMSATGGFSSLYSSSLNVRMNILQHVDEDNVVFFRVISTADGLVQVKTLFLLSRIEIESGYAVLLRSLDHEHLAPYSDHPSVQEQWADYYSWIVFEQAEESGQDCKLDFGGEIVSNVVVDSNAWMLEVLFIAVRWENTVFGPSLSLC